MHTKDDIDVSWEEVQAAQRRMKGHINLLNNIFNPGRDTSQEDRLGDAKELKAIIIPVLSLLVKDLKEVKGGDLPKSRPVCGSSSSINSRISEWASLILDSVNSLEETLEVFSSEEMMSHLDDLVE